MIQKHFSSSHEEIIVKLLHKTAHYLEKENDNRLKALLWLQPDSC